VDGRDMGTVVFPDAHLKFFLVGDRQIRTERRYQEMLARGVATTREEILQDIITRDNTDYL
jgi:cytidylate kinase